MTITVTPLEEGFGAEISGIDLSRPLDGEDRRAVYQAFLDSRLIVFRDQDMSPDNAIDAARILGNDLEPHLFKHFHHPDTPLIMVLSNRVNGDGQPKGMKDAGTFWHSDVSYKPNPAKATFLYAREVPDEGGDTLFCDLTAAYDAMPGDMQDRLHGLIAMHDYNHVPRDIFSKLDVTPPPPCPQPVVRTHPETGRKAIYINPGYTTHIEGLEADESADLIKDIFRHCLQDRFRMRYNWRAGDVVAWDNAATMHSATTKNLDPAKHRTIWRLTVSGGPAF
ncbi:MAG: TauD/TfdA family dioxygenase [Rhodospirillales bacterium]|nr:TauD/TfdA family dioxygenase [Alphaproteobacteria bacterium]MBL6947786.1 TauD/TfdA family dioxygenase [Rhodospirillales bacterium]